MGLKKYLKIRIKHQPSLSEQAAQSILEYVLLVSISIVALLAFNFVLHARDNAFTDHFETVADYIAPGAF